MGDVRILAIDLELVLWSIHFVQDQAHPRHSLLEISNRCFRRCWTTRNTFVAHGTLPSSIQTGKLAFCASNVVGAWNHDYAICDHIHPDIRSLVNQPTSTKEPIFDNTGRIWLCKLISIEAESEPFCRNFRTIPVILTAARHKSARDAIAASSTVDKPETSVRIRGDERVLGREYLVSLASKKLALSLGHGFDGWTGPSHLTCSAVQHGC